jgi:universal stress protein A
VENSVLWTGVGGKACDFVLVQREMEEAARKKLSAIVGPNTGRRPKTMTVVKAGGSPAFVIADYAKEAKIDLVVIGTHGRGMMEHLLIGSVAEQVVRIAPCPVLTVRSPKHESVMPEALQAVAAVRK